jgi:hypothetical protein
MDIESNFTNNTTGTLRDPDVQMRQRERVSRDFFPRSPSRFEQPSPLENRSPKTLYDAYHYDSRQRAFEQQLSTNPQDVRTAKPTSNATNPTQLYPCANCEPRATKCDSLKCFTCLATFPTAALRQTDYMSTSQYTLPSSPFLSKSAAEMQNSSPYDSGYYSSFSTASGPGQPPFSCVNSDIDDQVEHYIRDQRTCCHFRQQHTHR